MSIRLLSNLTRTHDNLPPLTPPGGRGPCYHFAHRFTNAIGRNIETGRLPQGAVVDYIEYRVDPSKLPKVNMEVVNATGHIVISVTTPGVNGAAPITTYYDAGASFARAWGNIGGASGVIDLKLLEALEASGGLTRLPRP